MRYWHRPFFALQDVAREFAVHDLPSFHIFDSGVLVERLSGLQSLQDIPMLLAAYQRLHKQEAGKLSGHFLC